MKVVYGGSFNPPTKAHNAIISYLSKHYESVILIPNGNRYEKEDLIDIKHRVKMLKELIKQYVNVEISLIESSRKFLGTFQTLRDLNHPLFACGDDCLKQFINWKNPEILLNENKFLIFSRENSSIKNKEFVNNDPFLSKYADKFSFVDIDFNDVSSSNFRNLNDYSSLENETRSYILKNNLYKEKNYMNYDYFKVALATPVVYLGSPLDNAKEIIKLAKKYDRASLIAFPELSITGYSVGDYFYNHDLLNNSLSAIQKIKDENLKSIIIVGAPLIIGGGLYNCAVVIEENHVLGIIPKVNLPNSNEFYEKRYFSSGSYFLDNPAVVEFLGEEVPVGSLLFSNKENNVSFGVEVCGDLWGTYNPHQDLFNKGALFVVNISGSSYYLGKDHIRKSLVDAASKIFSGGYLYTSNGPTDSTSDVTFSGNQLVSVCGETILDECNLTLNSVVNVVDIDLEYIRYTRISNSYTKDNVYFDDYVHFNVYEKEFTLEKKPNSLPFVLNSADKLNELINVCTLSLKKRLDHIGTNKVVIGVSGGLDSTLALLFAVHCFKRYKMDLKNIIAVTMPGFGTGNKSKNIARKLMTKLEVSHKEISIKKEATLHLNTLEHDMSKDVTYENTQARIRTLYLMNLANKENGIVLGTGDMSEIALGWSTFNGDQMSMYNLNANIPKTLVQELVKHFSSLYPELKQELLKVYNATISPELTDSTQSTEDFIGKYEINDFIMYHIFFKGASKGRLLYLLNEVFGLNNQDASIYFDRFMRRFKQNQFKRIASPESIKLLSFSFSPRGDFRFPGDMK